MGRPMGEELEPKAHLVREICSVAAIFASCAHRRRRSPRKLAFIDWYLILKVDEDVGIDAIRRRYRQLALQLHPDKNKHPKADVAFKLVSEAYCCLSDKARRKAFNSERCNSFCRECYKKFQPMSQENYNRVPKSDSKPRERAKPCRTLYTLREVQNRLREECEVIESCLRGNEAYRTESPLFDPAERRLSCPGYPHYRAQVLEETMDCRHFYTSKARSCWGRSASWESPVFKLRAKKQGARTNFGFRF